MKKPIFTCCMCGKHVLSADEDAYILQVRKVGEMSPEMMMSHGPCLRKAIPVVGVEIPKPSHR